MEKKHFQLSHYYPFFIILVLLILWDVWQIILLPQIHTSLFLTLILDSVLVKGVIWALIPLILLSSCKESLVPIGGLFTANVPLLPCLVLLALSAAFLNTVRILNGLIYTHVIFQYEMVLLSLTAGIYEEIGFRGYFFNVLKSRIGFFPAALLNGFVFTLYHFPSILVCNFAGIFSLRTLLLFSMGVIFCWIFTRWKSLTMNIIIHTAWDIMSYLFCLV